MRGADPSELIAPMTITLPSIALPAVTVQVAPPALITRRNAGHVGMTGNELLRVLREMRADPRFRDAVIARGKSFRAAPPDAIIAFLRAAPTSTDPASDRAAAADHGVDLSLLRAAGYELAPAASRPDPVKGPSTSGPPASPVERVKERGDDQNGPIRTRRRKGDDPPSNFRRNRAFCRR